MKLATTCPLIVVYGTNSISNSLNLIAHLVNLSDIFGQWRILLNGFIVITLMGCAMKYVWNGRATWTTMYTIFSTRKASAFCTQQFFRMVVHWYFLLVTLTASFDDEISKYNSVPIWGEVNIGNNIKCSFKYWNICSFSGVQLTLHFGPTFNIRKNVLSLIFYT